MLSSLLHILPIARGFSSKGTIGGNGHENWTLIRLLLLLIGHKVPEGDDVWNILMLLKDIVELAVATRHTEESIHFLDCKVSEHSLISDCARNTTSLSIIHR